MYIATATGFVDTDAALKREDDVLMHLTARARDIPDTFAAIAAALYSAASERAFALGQAHDLAAALAAGLGLERTVQTIADDVRMLLEAHLLFKRLAANEHRARITLGLGRIEDQAA